ADDEHEDETGAGHRGGAAHRAPPTCRRRACARRRAGAVSARRGQASGGERQTRAGAVVLCRRDRRGCPTARGGGGALRPAATTAVPAKDALAAARADHAESLRAFRRVHDEERTLQQDGEFRGVKLADSNDPRWITFREQLGREKVEAAE